jgi:hypothetical protein
MRNGATALLLWKPKAGVEMGADPSQGEIQRITHDDSGQRAERIA